MTYQEQMEVENLAGDFADQYKIKIAVDLERLSQQLHEAVETGLQDYVWDLKKEPGYEDLDNYDPQY